ncbi:MAG TPA: hypothetical protein PLH24_06205 [Candidatus Atribacteria bacterium]|jgi:hypothetical protein|nr:hypothetical protein [Atribacterota bacterium]HPT63841.1 hypothetical protein [Candidatus Atribacteria bacterium]
MFKLKFLQQKSYPEIVAIVTVFCKLYLNSNKVVKYKLKRGENNAILG